jgi:hypothetical protein
MNLLSNVAFALLWLAMVIDPVGSFLGFRYIAIILAVAIVVMKLISERPSLGASDSRMVLILIFSILLPIQGLVVYAIRSNPGEFLDTSYLLSGVLITFSLAYSSKADCLSSIKFFIISLRILTVLILISFYAYLYNQPEILQFFIDNKQALFGQRDYSGLTLPYLNFVAAPTLIYLACYDLKSIIENINIKNILLLSLTMFCMFVSGTRALILLMVLFIPAYYIINKGNSGFQKSLLFLISLLLVAVMPVDVREVIFNLFSPNDASNAQKIGYLARYSEIFTDWTTIFIGQGFNAHTWSLELASMVTFFEFDAAKTELTYIEIYRVYGFITGTIVILGLAKLVKDTSALHDDVRWIRPALILYLMSAILNPYLFSANGILPIALVSSLLVYAQEPSQGKIHIPRRKASGLT